jgi:hypothetical protein
MNDAGTAWFGPSTLGSSGVIQNSRCKVDAGLSSGSATGESVTLNLSVGFTRGFGPKSVYLYAQDNAGLESGWQQLGTWSAQ